LIAAACGTEVPLAGAIAILPLLVLTGLLLGAFFMLIASAIPQLENFAGIMNFIVFPTFFMSSALYPLWRVRESSVLLYEICRLNPFTSVVELLRHALYLQANWMALGVVGICLVIILVAGILAYDPAIGLLAKRGGGR
jgi:ABC-2 type transport system permease protein